MRLDDFDPDINVEDQGASRRRLRRVRRWRRRPAVRAAAADRQPLRVRRDRRRAAAARGVRRTRQHRRHARRRWRRHHGRARSVAGRRTGAAAVCTTDPAKRAACNAFSSAENTWEALFAQPGAAVPRARARLLRPERPLGLRRGAGGDGAVLLPDRQRHLSRHRLLRRAGQQFRRAGRLRAILRRRARIRPPHPEPDRRVRRGQQIQRRPVAPRATPPRSGSNCRPIATPASGPRRTATGWTRATSRKA